MERPVPKPRRRTKNPSQSNPPTHSSEQGTPPYRTPVYNDNPERTDSNSGTKNVPPGENIVPFSQTQLKAEFEKRHSFSFTKKSLKQCIS